MRASFHLTLDDNKRSTTIRSKTDNTRQYIGGVDDVLIKVIDTKKKNFKIICTEDRFIMK